MTRFRAVPLLIALLMLAVLRPAGAQLPGDFSPTPQVAQPGAPATVRAVLGTDALHPGQRGVIAVVLDIPEGFYAQSHRPLPSEVQVIPLAVKLNPHPNVIVYATAYPQDKLKTYTDQPDARVHSDRVVSYIPVELKGDAPLGPATLSGTITYQICNEQGVCLAPEMNKPFSIATQVVPPTQPLKESEPELFKNFNPASFSLLAQPARERVVLFGRELSSASLLFIFFSAFVIGLIFNIMPCVLPVLPLKAIGFYEVSQHNRARSIAFGLVFSLGLVASFAALGLLVVVLRKLDWGQLYANTWFLAGIIILLAVMALSMFGVFTVNLPKQVYYVSPRHDTYVGNFLFGILTAVLSTPCTFGMFLGLLVWATQQPAAMGLSLVTMVGVGMAFPYLVLSALPELARKMPRTGPWAELVKQMMGFLLLLSAAYFARRFITAVAGDKYYWWMLFAIVAAAAVFLLVRTFQFAKSNFGRLVAAVLAVVMLVPSGVYAYRLTNPPIDWKPYTPQALEEARKGGKTVLVEFTAAWCGNCLALEATVFHDARTVDAIKSKDVVTLRADLTRSDAVGWELLRQLSPVAAIPLTAVYAPAQPQPVKLGGLYSTDELVKVLSSPARSQTP